MSPWARKRNEKKWVIINPETNKILERFYCRETANNFRRKYEKNYFTKLEVKKDEM